MNVSLMSNGNIYFLDFVFNPKLRTLSCGDATHQLRKKEADVLSLLCERYPHPVSQDDFLSCVWEGGYVTPQSIAQVIRSLRRNLQDKEKQIIVTIPKLGYRFGVSPSVEEVQEQERAMGNAFPVHKECDPVYATQYDAHCGRFAYDRSALINLTPISVNSLAISPCVRPKKKNLRIRNVFIVVLFIGIIYLLWYVTKTPIITMRSAAVNEQSAAHSSAWAENL